jgi:hypothetical protein
MWKAFEIPAVPSPASYHAHADPGSQGRLAQVKPMWRIMRAMQISIACGGLKFLT